MSRENPLIQKFDAILESLVDTTYDIFDAEITDEEMKIFREWFLNKNRSMREVNVFWIVFMAAINHKD